jgi:hypothetical protein
MGWAMLRVRSSLVTTLVLVALFGAVAGSTLGAQESQPAPLAVEIAQLRQFLEAVADDSTMGRQTGSRGDDMAARYVASEFRQFGLQPAGEGGTFLQPVPFRARTINWSSTVVRIGADTLTIGKDYLPVLQSGTGPAGLLRPLHTTLAVFGGTLADSAPLIDSATARGRLVVLALPHDAPWSATYPVWLGLPKQLLGAAAIAVVALDIAPPHFATSVREPQLRLADPAQEAKTAATVLFISRAAAQRLLGVASDSARRGATGARVDGRVAVIDRLPDVTPHNVVAMLPGSDPTLRGTYVSLSAHHDHVGFNHRPVDHDSLHAYMDAYEHLRQRNLTLRVTPEQEASIHVNMDSLRRLHPPRRDSIFNGADDDASGITALLEIAKRLSASPQHPKRSILFLAHTGEEAGLLGSHWYSDHPTVPRDSIVAEMDMDMVGRGSARDLDAGGPDYLELIGSKRQSKEFGNLIDSVNAARPRPFHINYAFDAHDHPEQDWCRADHFSYARYGIPVGAFSTSYHGDYHQVTDETQYIDYPHLAAIAGFVGDLALTVANRDRRPLLDHPKPADPNAPCVQ